MSTAVQKALFKAKINDEIKQLFATIEAENVIVTDGGVKKALSTKLSEIIAEVATKATDEDVTTAVKAAIDALVGGAPEALDTLKELADKATENSDLLTDLKAISTDKVDKAEGMSLIADTLVVSLNTLNFTVLAGVTAEKVALWDNAQENVVEGVSVNGVAATMNGKTAEITVPVVHISESEPANIKNGELWIQPIND